MPPVDRTVSPAGLDLQERVVEINRVAKVVKGGRRFSFTALVVVGDESDVVGVGYGKANEVPLAIQKGVERAKKNLFRVPKHGSTITHQTLGHLRLRPACCSSPPRPVPASSPAAACARCSSSPGSTTSSPRAGLAEPDQPRQGDGRRPAGLRTPRGGRRAARPVDQPGPRPRRRSRRRRRRDARRPTPRRGRPPRPTPRGRAGAGARGVSTVKVTQVKSQERRRPAPARHAALARPAPHRPHGRGQGHPAGARAWSTASATCVEDRAMSDRRADRARSACTPSSPPRAAARPRKRVGRGEGSGTGKTAGRGQKGAARARARRTARASRAARCRSTCGCASCAART